jgi:hypothetical protein
MTCLFTIVIQKKLCNFQQKTECSVVHFKKLQAKVSDEQEQERGKKKNRVSNLR